MQYAPLGSTGIEVSRLCMGSATFGGLAGVNFIDTANVYPLGSEPGDKGSSERIIGQWLQGRRQRFVVATKGGGRMGPLPAQGGNSRQHLLDAIDASLQRLGTDHVDLYQLHYDDPATPLDESLAALDAIVRSGRARHAGLSNFRAWRLARAVGRCETNQWPRPVAVQPRYNLLFRQIERDVVPLCQEEGLGMVCYNPLAGGLLSGKHRFDAQPEAGGRFGAGKGAVMYKDRYWHEREFVAISAFVALAAQAGIEPVRLAVAWVLAQPGVTAAILGASSAGQLAPALAAADTRLAPDLLARLDELSFEFRMGDASR
jgi:aryl-alcohol dehydrogenase-like predicted oxidoreductase